MKFEVRNKYYNQWKMVQGEKKLLLFPLCYTPHSGLILTFELIIYGLITLKILLKSTDLRRQFIKCKTNRLKINVFANFDVIEFWRNKI